MKNMALATDPLREKFGVATHKIVTSGEERWSDQAPIRAAGDRGHSSSSQGGTSTS
jgi:hypothetical protein